MINWCSGTFWYIQQLRRRCPPSEKERENIEFVCKKKLSLPALIGIGVVAAAVIAAVILLSSGLAGQRHSDPEISVSAQLERVINVSELSTYTAVYNGIAEVKNEDNPEETEYYVSYEARVNAGFDMEKISVEADEEEKIIRITIPEITITKIEVDIASLDFIFCNDAANASTVTQEAYRACEEDVRAETERQTAILELARQNAVNVLTALTTPLVDQLDEPYTLEIA